MSVRIPCINDTCSGSILPATAEKTGGYCRPCLQAIKRKEQEDYIKKNRRDVDLYKGITNLAEVLIIMHQPKSYDPLINYLGYEKSREEVYALLSEEETAELKQAVLDLTLQEAWETAEQIVLEMACFTNASLTECLEALVEAKSYRASVAFKGASEKIRDELIQQVQSDACNRSELLLALAWIGDQKVVQLFNEWRSTPPEWKGELYVPPEEYSLETGWELTKDGEKRELFYRDCYGLEKADGVQPEAVRIIGEHEEKCRWCGTALTVLFDFDLTHPSLGFLQLPGTRLRIAACHICTCYGPVYTDIDGNGLSAWSQMNERPDYLPSDIGPDEKIENIHSLVMAKEKRSCYYAASQFLETSISQIGGHPTWIQDAEYPKCPKCATSMKFVGQVEGCDTMQYGEGVYYAFLCKECSMAATHYQQT